MDFGSDYDLTVGVRLQDDKRLPPPTLLLRGQLTCSFTGRPWWFTAKTQKSNVTVCWPVRVPTDPRDNKPPFANALKLLRQAVALSQDVAPDQIILDEPKWTRR